MITAPLEITYELVKKWPAYRVGDDGSVWSRKRGTWVRMKSPPDDAGYPCVNLCRGSKPTKFRVHILVLTTFRGPCPPGKEARHFPDRDPANCRLVNLSWSDHATNLRDRKTHGTDNAGERNGQCKASDDVAREIIRRRRSGDTIGELAWEFNMARSTISCICSGKRRAYLQQEVG